MEMEAPAAWDGRGWRRCCRRLRGGGVYFIMTHQRSDDAGDKEVKEGPSDDENGDSSQSARSIEGQGHRGTN
jgi:hypothetical protein